MGNAIIARLTPDRRSPWVVESPYPQRQDPVQHGIEEGLPTSGGEGGGSSIDTREVLMPQHQPWSNFTAVKLLPNSVYLWACDEPQPGGSKPSRSDAWVAWVVLITQMIFYTALISASSGEDTSTSSSSDKVTSTTNAGRYTFFSVAAAMYLMTSIAAADLGAGIALISEARMDMAAKRWVQRKMFGFMLLASFALLAAASIRVLFKTSSEDVELVVGAATVLFIADVDEKVMVVLKAVPSKWRLFWVLEAFGLSAALALLGLGATGNASTVSKNDNGYGDEKYLLIYSWYFIFCIHPVFVTVISLLVNAFVASPKEFVKKHVLGNGSRQDWLFALVLALWILVPLVLYRGAFLFLVLMTSIMCAGGIGRICWLFIVCQRSVCCRGSDLLISLAGYRNFRWTSSTKFGMTCVPVGLFLVKLVLDILAIKQNVMWWELFYLASDSWIAVPNAFHSALFHMWLVWCMCREGGGCPERPEMPSSLEAANIVVTEPVMIAGSQRQGAVIESHQVGGRLTRKLFLGWIQANALMALVVFYILYSECRWLTLLVSSTYWLGWTLLGLCAAASSTKGVAFWSLATYMLYIVSVSILVWISSSHSLKMHNFK